MLRAMLTFVLLLAAVDVLAQPSMTGGVVQPGLPGGRVQRPPREGAEKTTGTAVIRGRVVAAETGTPIRRAQIRAFSPGVRGSRVVSTDAQGRFELRDLPAGRWDLMAHKAGFISLAFGQRRPSERGRPIELADGETMTKVDFVLPRGAAIEGRVLDEFGDPVAGARVMAMRYQPADGQRRLVPFGMGGDQTDDNGAYRLYGLVPGDYYISAVYRGMGFGDEAGDSTGYASTYYPGTANVAEAQRITVAVGQALSDITFQLLPTRTVRITGTVNDSKGRPVSNGFVMLMEGGDGFGFSSSGGPLQPDGKFTIANVSPGSYTLHVNTGMGGPPREDTEFARVPITVGNEDLTGLHVITGKGTTVSGRIVEAPGSTSKLTLGGLRVIAQPPRGQRMMMMGGFAGSVEQDGSFVSRGLQGSGLIRIPGLPPTWMLQQVLLNGSDVTDTPLEFAPNDEISDVLIIVTDRVTEVNGKVTDAKGQPTRDYTVLVFPDAPDKRQGDYRYVRFERADQDGRFRIRALAPDVTYLAVAVNDLQEGDGTDPDFMREMEDRATRFTLGAGEVKVLDLKLVPR